MYLIDFLGYLVSFIYLLDDKIDINKFIYFICIFSLLPSEYLLSSIIIYSSFTLCL